ncbi:uncharacterized protein [Dermacentor andersoni]|uniref:uncharacterized protein n=1 Tax=Dermacentor andersoni TaxID=34620 RepID=UPI002417AEC3|nr:uncharacterized protein LOC129381334 [Dermacentor andersoni]
MSPACCMKRKRRLQASPQQRLFRPSSYKPGNFHGHFGVDEARVDRHAGCRPAASPSQRPEWNDSTKVSATFDNLCKKETHKKERALTKAHRKTRRGAEARVKMDPNGEATKSSTPYGLAPLKLPDYSFLFKPVCFSPDCSDADGHFQCWPLKRARIL